MKARALFLVLALAALGLWLRPAPDWKFATAAGADVSLPAEFRTIFEYRSAAGTAHAPAFVENGAGVVWFDGIRESHNDVRILGAELAGGEVVEHLTRQGLSARMVPGQTVLTLGNTIEGDGGLLTTAVSLGGWAASSVVFDGAQGAQKLNLSPLLNRSFLVKSPVVEMADGQLLPTYFEMGGAYGAAALLDDGARVRGLSAMAGGVPAIQPMIVPLAETRAVALLRNFDPGSDRLLASWTQDGGQSWSAPEPLNLPNPSAPVAAVSLSDGRILMLSNDAADRADVLRFAVSDDGGRSWAWTRVLDGPGKGDLRYPAMAVLDDGRIAATYSTGSKAGIVAHVLSAQWAMGN